MNTPSGYTSDQAAQAAAAAGLILTEQDYAAIEGLQRSEQARIALLATNDETGIVAAYTRLFPKLIAVLLQIGDTALSLARALIIAAGAPVVLICLLVVEVQRVSGGVFSFAHDNAVATFAALALVLANVVIEVMLQHREHIAGFTAQRAVRWSLRIAAQNGLYRLGIGKNWTPAELSPAQRYRQARALTTGAMLFLAITGSMRDAIASAGNERWYTALWQILTQSSLSSASVWLSGLLYAVVAIVLAQILAAYVSSRSVEVLEDLKEKSRALTVDTSSQMDAIKAQYVFAKTAAKLAQDAELERQRIDTAAQAERQRIEAVEAAERARLDAIEVERLRIEAAERQEAANALARENARIAREERKTRREVPADDRQPGVERFLSVAVPPANSPIANGNGHAESARTQ